MPRMKAPRSDAGPFAGSVSLGSLSRRLGVPRRRLRRLVAEGRTPFVQIAGRIRIPNEAVGRFVRLAHAAAARS